MIKYEIKIPVFENIKGIVRKTGFDFKTVNKKQYKEFIEKGWTLHRKKYFIITSFLDWWKTLTSGNKIAVFAIIIPTLVAVLFGVLAHRSNKENDSLKLENKTLNENYNQLKQTLILTSDSLKIERKTIENLSQQLQSKKAYDKNTSD